MKTLFVALVALAFVLSGCSTNPTSPTSSPNSSINQNYGKLINKKVHTEEWNKVKVDIYYIGLDTVAEKYAFAFSSAKPTDEVIAVRYDFTNVTDETIDIFGINITNAGFDKPEKPLGSVNYSSISLHKELGFDTIPKEWDGKTEWLLKPNETKSVSFDWLVENKDYKMTYSWLFPFEKEYRIFNVVFQ